MTSCLQNEKMISSEDYLSFIASKSDITGISSPTGNENKENNQMSLLSINLF